MNQFHILIFYMFSEKSLKNINLRIKGTELLFDMAEYILICGFLWNQDHPWAKIVRQILVWGFLWNQDNPRNKIVRLRLRRMGVFFRIFWCNTYTSVLFCKCGEFCCLDSMPKIWFKKETHEALHVNKKFLIFVQQ